MFFTILNRYGHYPKKTSASQVFLTWDDWNDFNFYTLFGIFYVDKDGNVHDLGSIKIGYFGQSEGHKNKKLAINDTFDTIPNDHFSIGLDDNYYTTLNALGVDIRDKILLGLNDIAKNNSLLDEVMSEPVYQVSFLRGLSQSTIEGRFRRLSDGDSRITSYNFTYVTPSVDEIEPFELTFKVQPHSNPPTNIHVIIGRNGVGKTFIIHSMIESLSKSKDKNKSYGAFYINEEDDEEESFFANLICVSFSAFDEFSHPPEVKNKAGLIQYSYIGLKSIGSGSQNSNSDTGNLDLEFSKSLYNIKLAAKSNRWKQSIAMLESDPEFKTKEISTLIDPLPQDESNSEDEMKGRAIALYKTLSSGHKVVLLIITRLVEKLEERSLLLIDEPESHLHPPLLSSLMRALTKLLIDRNAVSIIASHSPVVLQEVPKECVWRIRRNGKIIKAERLQIETFGENVGVLTNELFALEVSDSGFHRILKNLVESCDTYEKAIARLNNQLGMEARAILRGMFYQKRDKK